MKKIVIALIFAVGLGVAVVAQKVVKADVSASFTPINFTEGSAVDTARLFMGKVETDGATCYFLSTAKSAGFLESLDQIKSLGCVKE